MMVWVYINTVRSVLPVLLRSLSYIPHMFLLELEQGSEIIIRLDRPRSKTYDLMQL